jgi:hypothetical protein
MVLRTTDSADNWAYDASTIGISKPTAQDRRHASRRS